MNSESGGVAGTDASDETLATRRHRRHESGAGRDWLGIPVVAVTDEKKRTSEFAGAERTPCIFRTWSQTP